MALHVAEEHRPDHSVVVDLVALVRVCPMREGLRDVLVGDRRVAAAAVSTTAALLVLLVLLPDRTHAGHLGLRLACDDHLPAIGIPLPLDAYIR